MLKFSNKANRKEAETKGAELIEYNHNGDSLRERSIELHGQGAMVYYENQKPCKQYPNGASHLYKVNQ